MQRVKLYTMGGGFVVAGWIPPFLQGLEAEVIVWGERIFGLKRHPGDGLPKLEADGAMVYYELFAVALVNTEPNA